MLKQTTRLAVQKTYKLFIGGKFARVESGRIIAARDAEGKVLTNYCRASRKDFRDAVRAARNAVAGWTQCSAYWRGQILRDGGEVSADEISHIIGNFTRGETPDYLAFPIRKRSAKRWNPTRLTTPSLYYSIAPPPLPLADLKRQR